MAEPTLKINMTIRVAHEARICIVTSYTSQLALSCQLKNHCPLLAMHVVKNWPQPVTSSPLAMAIGTGDPDLNYNILQNS